MLASIDLNKVIILHVAIPIGRSNVVPVKSMPLRCSNNLEASVIRIPAKRV